MDILLYRKSKSIQYERLNHAKFKTLRNSRLCEIQDLVISRFLISFLNSV